VEWTVQQQAAIDAVRDWFANRTATQQVFRLFGYAGTGKTTLAKACAESVTGNVLFGSFTGKAAHVLRQKGCGAARTIHSLIYQPRDKSSAYLAELKELYTALLAKAVTPEERERHEEKCRELANAIAKEQSGLKQPAFSLNLESDVQHCRLVVIDEVSMVGEQMGRDLLFFEKPVLVLGDPAQLPPVADGGYFTTAKPDVMLEEVHRQAEGSPVIALATRVRGGRALAPGAYGESAVVPRGTVPVEEIARGFDQALCGRNATRRALNAAIRRTLGRTSPFPVEGDRLVCLRNNHEMGLLNGSLWNVQVARELDEKEIALSLAPQDGGREVHTTAHKAVFLGKELDYFERRDADEFDFGYALTVHKAQGSQWPSVYVVDESTSFREHARRWLYTAITRAAERVTVSS
jgi:exodeoxyribonuclease-5